MIKLRKYFKGYTRMYIHGTVKGKDVKLRGELNRPEWVSEDIDLLNPILLQRKEWRTYVLENTLVVLWSCQRY